MVKNTSETKDTTRKVGNSSMLTTEGEADVKKALASI